MPPKAKFTREEIVSAALEITRAGGISAVTARAVGSKLTALPDRFLPYFRTWRKSS